MNVAPPHRPQPSDPHDHTDLELYLDSAIREAKALVAAEKKAVLLLAYEKIGKAAGSTLVWVIAGTAVLLCLLFASAALAIYLGVLLNSPALGFLLVGGLYLLIFLIVHFLLRRGLRDSTMLSVINSFYDEND